MDNKKNPNDKDEKALSEKTCAQIDAKKGKGRRRGRNFDKRPPRVGGNDFEFWNLYPELMDVATRFPWMHIAGTPLSGTGTKVNLPNVAVQHYYSIPGVAKSATDPINLAFRQLYLDMHRKYRGIGAYQASDIAITMVCIESVLQLIVEAERIYGILKSYPIKSRIAPEGLLIALGYSAGFVSSVKTSLADFRYSVNRLVELARRLPLPAGMNFFKNHVALNAFIYRDSKDERSALLAFAFDNFYRYTTSGGSGLINNATTAVSVPFNRASILTPAQLITLIETELNALLTDTDVLRITSDMIACYGEENMQVLTSMPEDYTVTPMYSETILHKWHNSERIPVGQSSGSTSAFKLYYGAISSSTTQLALANYGFEIYQENDVVISFPVVLKGTTGNNNAWRAAVNLTGSYIPMGDELSFSYLYVNGNSGHINDSWMADPSKEFVCESLLWKIELDADLDSGSTHHGFPLALAGTEFLTELYVYKIVNSTLGGTGVCYPFSWTAFNGSITLESGLCHFDWAPLLLAADSTHCTANIFGDVDNVTITNRDIVRKILDAALLSAFKVQPKPGNINTN